MEKEKITGGRQKEELLLERIVQETISGKDDGIQHTSSKEALQGKFSSHFSAQLSYLPLKLIFKTDPALPPSFFHSLETHTTYSKEAKTSLRLEDTVKRSSSHGSHYLPQRNSTAYFLMFFCSHSEPYNKTNLKHQHLPLEGNLTHITAYLLFQMACH